MTNVFIDGASVADPVDVVRLVLKTDGAPVKDRQWPEMPLLVEHSEYLLWHRTSRIPAPPGTYSVRGNGDRPGPAGAVSAQATMTAWTDYLLTFVASKRLGPTSKPQMACLTEGQAWAILNNRPHPPESAGIGVRWAGEQTMGSQTSDSSGRADRDPRADRPENVRASIHFHAWGALSRLSVATERADGTKWETAARATRAELEHLLDEVEADAAGSGIPLVRPSFYRDDVGAFRVALDAPAMNEAIAIFTRCILATLAAAQPVVVRLGPCARSGPELGVVLHGVRRLS